MYVVFVVLFITPFASNANNVKTVSFFFKNESQKKLEIIIETQDTTIVHKLGENKKTHSYILLNLDSDSFYFKITLKKKHLFRGEFCAENEIGMTILNEAMCSKTNKFMLDLFFHNIKLKVKSKRFPPNTDFMFLRSCCEGGYIEIGNWFKSSKP